MVLVDDGVGSGGCSRAIFITIRFLGVCEKM
jgi:hypothetical protein